MSDKYWEKNYSVIFGKGYRPTNELFIEKKSESDWSHITMMTNSSKNGTITIRSKEMAEQLHFMLGQMLDK